MASIEHLISLTDPAYQQWLDVLDDDHGIDSGVVLYSRQTLPERNTTFEVAEYAPGYLMIGDDSGGYGFLLACTSTPGPVFHSDLGSLQLDGFLHVADTFSEWRATGFSLPTT
ncbi:hypothetical protein [Cryptosporangium japonicum]|uniref:SMI1/KNR4 family protein n=1 Tax=Cryptosporangium japonicum TaxID=80872 RepID=A0ABP3D740_9ACTN